MEGFGHIDYAALNARQKENYNFHKVAARLADYGFNCLRLTDDWQGADFIASHIDGETFLKVQLKGRLTIERKYVGKDIHIAFNENGDWYLYPHDEMSKFIDTANRINNSRSWRDHRSYSWPSPPKWIAEKLKDYRL